MEYVDRHTVWENFMITKKDYKPVSWVVEGLIPAQAITLLTGWRGSFKTYLSLGVGAAVSIGTESFAGMRSEVMPVFYVNRDNPQPVFTSRLRQFRLLDERNQNFAHWSLWHRFGPPPKLDGEGFEYYRDLAGTYTPLIIFDSLQRFHSGDENSAKDMAAIFEKFRELTTVGATVMVLHNSGKDKKGARGVSAIEDGVDMILELTAKRGSAKQRGTNLTLTITKDKLTATEGERLVLRPVTLPGGKLWFHVLDYLGRQANHLREKILNVIKQHGEGLSGRAIIGKVGGKAVKISEALRALEEEGAVTVKHGPRNASIYFLP